MLVVDLPEGPEIEPFCRPVPKFLSTSAKPDGVFLISGVRGEPSWGGGIYSVAGIGIR